MWEFEIYNNKTGEEILSLVIAMTTHCAEVKI